MFLTIYKRDPTIWRGQLFQTLDKLFAAVDAYCADPRILQDVGGLDGNGLRDRAELTLQELRAIRASSYE